MNMQWMHSGGSYTGKSLVGTSVGTSIPASFLYQFNNVAMSTSSEIDFFFKGQE